MKTQLVEKLENLLTQNAGEVANEVRSLQKEYQKLWTEEFEKARQEFINEGGKARDFTYEKSEDDKKITELFEKFNKLKKEDETRLAQEQQKNLAIREEIISKIKDLSQLSVNVGAAVKKLQELQTQWKDTGPVSPHKYKEIQAEYSRATEDFYYNLKIYRELQDHDLKKNLELKQSILEKVKALSSLENIKDTERLIKVYRNDWEDVGPVPGDKWDALKQEFKAALEDVYARVKQHYSSIEERKENNLHAKKSLIEKAKTLMAETEGADVNGWNEATNKLLEIQNEWKTIGRTGQKDNDAIWAEFRAVCDEFFDKKKAYFNVIHEKQTEIKKIKLGFIEKAEALQNSTDWQKTAQELMKLQDDWKKHHLLNEREEGRMFFRFRKACNTFFDAKKAHFDAISASFEGNVKAKEELLEKITAFTLPEDTGEAVKQLKAFSDSWNAAGQVPFKDKKRLNDAFFNRLDELYDQLNVNKSEKQLLQFRNKVERMVMSENAEDLLRREADYLRKQMDEVNGRIMTYENNLGFFKHTRGDNPLVQEVNQKIEVEKQKLNDFSSKRKLIIAELNKLKENSRKAETVG